VVPSKAGLVSAGCCRQLPGTAVTDLAVKIGPLLDVLSHHAGQVDRKRLVEVPELCQGHAADDAATRLDAVQLVRL